MTATHRGPGSNKHIPLLLRAVILGLNWHADMRFGVISEKLGVNQRTATGLVQRAKERAADPTDFMAVLACLEDQRGGGRPKGSKNVNTRVRLSAAQAQAMYPAAALPSPPLAGPPGELEPQPHGHPAPFLPQYEAVPVPENGDAEARANRVSSVNGTHGASGVHGPAGMRPADADVERPAPRDGGRVLHHGLQARSTVAAPPAHPAPAPAAEHDVRPRRHRIPSAGFAKAAHDAESFACTASRDRDRDRKSAAATTGPSAAANAVNGAPVPVAVTVPVAGAGGAGASTTTTSPAAIGAGVPALSAPVPIATPALATPPTYPPIVDSNSIPSTTTTPLPLLNSAVAATPLPNINAACTPPSPGLAPSILSQPPLLLPPPKLDSSVVPTTTTTTAPAARTRSSSPPAGTKRKRTTPPVSPGLQPPRSPQRKRQNT